MSLTICRCRASVSTFYRLPLLFKYLSVRVAYNMSPQYERSLRGVGEGEKVLAAISGTYTTFALSSRLVHTGEKGPLLGTLLPDCCSRRVGLCSYKLFVRISPPPNGAMGCG